MNPFGYLFVAAGLLLIRQVAVGRVDNLAEDTRDMANALLSGDTQAIQEVSQRRGENVSVKSLLVAQDLADASQYNVPLNAGNDNASKLMAEVQKLGNKASGYVLGASGPKYYDCSGLVWRALTELGLFHGTRFTTATFPGIAGQFAYQRDYIPGMPAKPTRDFGFEDAVSGGDILVWPGKHMGVALRGTVMYSARSASKNPQIGPSDFVNDAIYFGSWPQVWSLYSDSQPFDPRNTNG